MPTAKPCSVAWRASLVELLPVLPMTKMWSLKRFTVWLMSMMCSSQSISCRKAKYMLQLGCLQCLQELAGTPYEN